MKLPFSSFSTSERTATKTGNSYTTTLPPEFIKALETLQDRKLKLINLNNHYLVYYAIKTSHNELYDLLQLILESLEALHHATERDDVKQVTAEVYERLTNLQYVLE